MSVIFLSSSFCLFSPKTTSQVRWQKRVLMVQIDRQSAKRMLLSLDALKLSPKTTLSILALFLCSIVLHTYVVHTDTISSRVSHFQRWSYYLSMMTVTIIVLGLDVPPPSTTMAASEMTPEKIFQKLYSSVLHRHFCLQFIV